jgi:hypothetical protein
MKFALVVVSLLSKNVLIEGLRFSGSQTSSASRLLRPRLPNSFIDGRTALSSKKKIAVSDDDSQIVLDVPVAYPQVPNFSGDTFDIEKQKSNRLDSNAVDELYNIEIAQTDTPSTPSFLTSKSFLLLNSVAIIWGTQHVVIKSALENFPSPSVLNFWRFALSFLLFLPAFGTVLVRMSFRMSVNSSSVTCISDLFLAFLSLFLNLRNRTL